MSARSTKKRQRILKILDSTDSEKTPEEASTHPKQITCDLEEGRLKADSRVIGMLCHIGPGDLEMYISSVGHGLNNDEKTQAWQFVIQYYEKQIEKMKEACTKLQS